MSLLRRSLVLVGICLLPAVAVQVSNEWESRRAREAELRNEALQQVRLAAADLRRVVEGFHRFLITLSRVPEVRDAQLPGCQTLLEDMAQLDPIMLNIGVSNSGGRILCSAVPMPPNVTSADEVQLTAIENGRFAIGEYAIGRAVEVPVIHLALPLEGSDERTNRVLWLALKLSGLREEFARRLLPPGADIEIADRNGTILLHTPGEEEWAGKRLPDPLISLLNEPATGTIEAVGLDGRERVFGFAPLGTPPGDLFVAVGLDRAAAFAEIDRATRRGIGLILAGLLGAALVAWLGARNILLRPLGAILEVVKRWRAGDYTARTRLTEERSEIRRLGAAFDEMAEAIETRQRALEEATRRAEERRAEAERAQRHGESLTREISHRTKNNLQLIASLLDLQGRSSGIPEVQEQFADARSRVVSVARVHERLYRSDLPGRVEFGQYLRGLCQDLQGSLGRDHIRLVVSAEAAELPLDQAVPLGLIVTELVTNAFKHGFPNGAEGTVEVSFGVSADQVIRLRVGDSGAGLPPGFRVDEGKRLGMRILVSVLRQLGGSLDVVPGATGATFLVRLPLGSAAETTA